LNRTVSLYLDLVRFTAAIVVFLGHAGLQRISGGFLYHFERYGETSVDIFFVLSGFVIAYVTSTKETTVRDYAINRLARVYSVALPAVIVSALLDVSCRMLAPATYATFPAFLIDGSVANSAAALAFVSHHWFSWTQPGMNGPYWSLCFEVWYYLSFGFLAFGRGGWRYVGVAGTLLIAGPKIAALFPLWLLGVGCFYLCQRVTLPRVPGLLIWLGTLAALVLWDPQTNRGGYPSAMLEMSWTYFAADAADYAMGGLFALNILGFQAISDRLATTLGAVSRPIRYLAGASFTIYLFHYPLIHFVAAVTPWPVTDWRSRVLVFLGTPVLLLAIAAVTERRKDSWRHAFIRLFAMAGALRAQ
jgi:peptidoglycan/LPS O-acetylase OafA/YrhL